ncbi:GNAT family N-acetyltransferase [Tellurirhabdus bombi]|uniref:GNAT family N-acetyltransferase n=1 Tax=Tellurirhabdus bombi TaxID=2907205 RepID=UPI001F1F30A8|nr:GNAT family N-acetyltransferase [Tellurirhabdus bombi]
MSLAFHTATTRDIPALIALQQQIWEPTYRPILEPDQIKYMFDTIYSPDALAEQMGPKNHTFVLAYAESTLIGFAAFSEDAEAGSYKLHKLYVLPTVQGRGWGRQLLEEVVRRCQRLEGSRLLLNVNRHNPALQFYIRQGFAIVREEDIPIGPYWMNDFVMELPLQKL